jgi:uncharacterized membrane-anchored protein
MRAALVLVGLVIALAVPNIAIVQKERLLASGTTMLVELAPVDPRSLIQGDYMRLDYALARELGWDREWPRDGHLVVRLDENGVARFVRHHVPGSAVGPAEHLLQYRRRASRIRIGTDAFYFQEGHAARYEAAKYGELRVDGSGASVLVGLRDADLEALGGVPR